MARFSDTYVKSPNGRLLKWALGHNEDGAEATVFCGAPVTVQVAGEFHGAQVAFVGGLDQATEKAPMCSEDGERVRIDAPCVMQLPCRPVVIAPQVTGGDANTAITITIFLGD